MLQKIICQFPISAQQTYKMGMFVINIDFLVQIRRVKSAKAETLCLEKHFDLCELYVFYSAHHISTNNWR